MCFLEFTLRLYAHSARHPRLCLRADVNCPSYFICQPVAGHVSSASALNSNQQIQFEFRSRAVKQEEDQTGENRMKLDPLQHLTDAFIQDVIFKKGHFVALESQRNSFIIPTNESLESAR